ncbi:TIGR00153 family protein [Psychrosphaera sp. B3R10]|uniref:TIGR00153 family protein n=1 Tax=Psychrosphaera algicola TaxID=3023714 RepID=A0ABT5FH86_9GAMM|nr:MULTISPECIES: TIGR00153 family protein [unclassified Psychrosphaera]MBU2882912.1 TIGR00153 family protein [Psychrosphaera sp. I2R16]MBU2991309.1 TIGR00153 family protein [Psychrosphaera sp. B3R10]MDC2890558.1 TIGR00153 family protein [Psychrosphaera sp. G1-22]MDO6720198.1 TIGR00153 family protein [Psychrosphaera sp. 1_MG-2023]
MAAHSILGVFAKSPLKPLEEHINQVQEAVELLLPFFDAVFAEDWQEAAKIRAQISHAEKQADVLKREIRMNLPRGLFLPVERTDLLELITQQDKIANRAKDISGRFLGRELTIPLSIQTEFKAFIQRNVDATEQARKAINEFDELLETGFRGREVELVARIITELDKIEDDTDTMQINIRMAYKKLENELNPIDVMVTYRMLEWIGDLADVAERVGSRLELMLAR